jgi:hypothetical protein
VFEIDGKRTSGQRRFERFRRHFQTVARVCPVRAGLSGRFHSTSTDHELVISHRNIHIAPHHQL